MKGTFIRYRFYSVQVIYCLVSQKNTRFLPHIILQKKQARSHGGGLFHGHWSRSLWSRGLLNCWSGSLDHSLNNLWSRWRRGKLLLVRGQRLSRFVQESQIRVDDGLFPGDEGVSQTEGPSKSYGGDCESGSSVLSFALHVHLWLDRENVGLARGVFLRVSQVLSEAFCAVGVGLLLSLRHDASSRSCGELASESFACSVHVLHHHLDSVFLCSCCCV